MDNMMQLYQQREEVISVWQTFKSPDQELRPAFVKQISKLSFVKSVLIQSFSYRSV